MQKCFKIHVQLFHDMHIFYESCKWWTLKPLKSTVSLLLGYRACAALFVYKWVLTEWKHMNMRQRRKRSQQEQQHCRLWSSSFLGPWWPSRCHPRLAKPQPGTCLCLSWRLWTSWINCPCPSSPSAHSRSSPTTAAFSSPWQEVFQLPSFPRHLFDLQHLKGMKRCIQKQAFKPEVPLVRVPAETSLLAVTAEHSWAGSSLCPIKYLIFCQ